MPRQHKTRVKRCQPPTLPIEICERVLDNLDDYWNTLAFYRCCLVCRDWVPRSRLYLYTSIELPIRNLTKFVRGISLRPFNGHLVRKLTLSEDILKLGSDHHNLSLVPIQLPQLLPNLRHIQFHVIHFANLHPKFFTYLSRFRSVRSACLVVPHCPTIMQLARCLTAYPHLDECRIHINNYSVQSLSFPGERLPTKRIAVPNLTLMLPPNPQLAGLILTIFSPSSIRELQIGLNIWFHQDEVPSDREKFGQLVASFVTRCAGALSELRLKFGGWDNLDLSQNTSLVSLHVSMFGLGDNEHAAASLSYRSAINRTLSTVRSTHLKKLHLEIVIVADSKDTISPSGWGELDATLALPTFRKVEYTIIIKVIVTSPRDKNSNFSGSIWASKGTMRQLLPQLAARSVADFSPPENRRNHVRDFEISSPDKQDALELETVDSETSQPDDQGILQPERDDSEIPPMEDLDELESDTDESKVPLPDSQEGPEPENCRIGERRLSTRDNQHVLQLEIADPAISSPAKQEVLDPETGGSGTSPPDSQENCVRDGYRIGERRLSSPDKRDELQPEIDGSRISRPDIREPGTCGIGKRRPSWQAKNDVPESQIAVYELSPPNHQDILEQETCITIPFPHRRRVASRIYLLAEKTLDWFRQKTRALTRASARLRGRKASPPERLR